MFNYVLNDFLNTDIVSFDDFNYDYMFDFKFCKHSIKEVLSVCSFNVNGNLERKLENNDFINEFGSYDLIFFSETWSCEQNRLELAGFDKIVKHRKKLKRAKRCSGGICIYIKKIYQKVSKH